ncbi:methionyl tRNA synthetase [Russula aff. rugulosa BPL654]|nr:methionyl tRNA synthetase [Russula aff. rugulosa BPL654]
MASSHGIHQSIPTTIVTSYLTMPQRIRDAEGLLQSVPDPGQLVLPKDGEQNILITSALPYCNNVPHLGNIIGSTLSADVYSRYSRTRNRRTLYICGTDEYGTATETRALKEGITPRQLCDKYYKLHRETYEWFEIGFDYFGRTSTPLHTEICQEIYLNLKKDDNLVRQEKEQTYCEDDQKFLADRFVEGVCPHCNSDDARGDQCDACGRTLDAVELINPRCILDKTHKVVTRVSSHIVLEKGKWSPNSVINSEGVLIDARLKGGLRPSPVTRDLKWGVPVPVPDDDPDQDMKGKVFYVWYDAPIGYVSITANLTSEWKQWWLNPQNVHLYQFMGKDNVYFHTIYFPSVQIGDGRDWTTLHHLSTTEYLNYESGKFSKSHNQTADAMFSWDDCVAANNNILLNKRRYPGPLSPNDEIDSEFVAAVNGLLKDYTEAMDAVKLRLGLQTVMLLSQRGNLYLQSSGLNKALMTENPTRCAQVVTRAVNLIYVLSALVYPFMPSTSVTTFILARYPVGAPIGTPGTSVQEDRGEDGRGWRAKFAGNSPAPAAPASESPKRKAAAKKSAQNHAEGRAREVDGPKSPEALALDAKIVEQGDLVRDLKARTPRTKELDEETAVAIAELKKFKVERAALPN